MPSDPSKFRQQLIDDYKGAVVRLATLRADGEHFLLFAWVELYPHDMNVPDGWTSGEKPWTVPQTPSWSCAVSARRMTVDEALDWYAAAATGKIEIERTNAAPIRVQAVQLGPEPAYGRFCVGGEQPFALLWHGHGPRIHRYVPLSASPSAVRRLGKIAAARTWLERNLGFDPYRFDEWLGGIALVAPDPVCSSVSVFPSKRSEDGSETLAIYVVPRRSAEQGIAQMSGLSVHIAERRTDGWSSVNTVALDAAGYATIANPQSWSEVAYALECSKRGLLRILEPSSWVEQIVVGTNVSNSTLMVAVPSGGRRKPAKTVPVHRFFKAGDVAVGKPLNDFVCQRLVALRERRMEREKRTEAPQKVFGITREKAQVGEDEIKQKRKEAEDFIAGLIFGARQRVLFVDPFFGFRETRLFALRVSNVGVVPRVLTGMPGLERVETEGTPGQSAGDLLVADLRHLAQTQGVQVPQVRVMPGSDKPVIHDRYLVIDKEVWHCGPSFNELGERLGVMVRLPDPLSVRRFLSAIWARSLPLDQSWPKERLSSGDAS